MTNLQIGEFELEAPFINGCGVVKTLEDIKAMSATAVGAVAAGSYTLEPREGSSPNGETVYYHDRETGITYNSLGMPNKGIEVVSKEIPSMLAIVHNANKPLIVNIAPVTDDPLSEISEMIDIIDTNMREFGGTNVIDAIELNASCPNVVTEDGGRHELLSQHPDLLFFVLNGLRIDALRTKRYKDVHVRVSPPQKREELVELVRVFKETGVKAVSAWNTFPGGVPRDENGEPILQVKGNMGGKSGRGMNGQAKQKTRWLEDEKRLQKAHFSIIGSNGVSDGLSMLNRLQTGAVAVSATTLFFEAENWGEPVEKILTQYVDLSLTH